MDGVRSGRPEARRAHHAAGIGVDTMNMESLRVENAGWFGTRTRGKEIGEESGVGILAAAKKIAACLLRFLARPRAASESLLRIEEKVSLGSKKMLFVVHCDGRRFLVATGAETVTSPIELLPERTSQLFSNHGKSTGRAKAKRESRG